MVCFKQGRLLAALLVTSCVADGGDNDGTETSAGSTSASTQAGETPGSESSTGASTSTGSPTSAPGVTSAATTLPPTAGEAGDESSTGSPLPEGPGCSVQVVTHGELFDPLPKGEEAGLFPVSVGETLEDYCGCHTLTSNAQNVEHTGLKAPGGTLFLDYSDIGRSFGGGTLGQAMAEEVFGYAMPPGSCSYPSDAAGVLRKWFEEDMPDGSNFAPPSF
ncbi:MAG: hypothetical protein KUG77_19845 [Nannocystaceae bacterium]|nr:hypothetical protein [Nannocystaceae bacterium]